MKKLNIVFSMVLLFMAAACYKDLGNYDYEDINRIEIKFEKAGALNYIIGDVVEVNPIYPDIVLNNRDNYEFKWILDGETRPEWNTMNFRWESDEIVDYAELVIEVTDKRTDMVYMNLVRLTVSGVYTNDYSWMILSDDGGKSRLSFLAVSELIDEDSKDQPAGSSQAYYASSRFMADAFIGDLGTGPIALQEHWRKGIDWSETVVGNVIVFQKSGAVDLNGSDFTKEIDMKDAFVGQTYPESNTVLYPGTCMEWADVVADQNGKLYSRLKLANTVYNSEYFMLEPMRLGDETECLENCTVCRGMYAANRFGYQVIYDGKNKRMLYVQDGGYSDAVGASRIVPVVTDPSVDESSIVPLGNHEGYELLHISEHQGPYIDWDFHYGFYEVLRDESDNKVYLQTFYSKKPWGQTPLVTSITKEEIMGLPGLPDVCAFPIYGSGNQEYAFIAVGSDVYLLDLLDMTKPVELYYHFDSPVTAMDFGSMYNMHLAVGLEDGSFYVLGAVEAKNCEDAHKLIYKSEEKVGRIVDIKYKNNDMWNY